MTSKIVMNHTYTPFTTIVLSCSQMEFTNRLCEIIVTYKHVKEQLYCVQINGAVRSRRLKTELTRESLGDLDNRL